MAIRGWMVTAVSRYDRLKADFQHFTTIIMAACVAQMVRTLQLAAVRAFLECFGGQRIMAAAHTALRRGSFAFWDSHVGTYSISK